MMLTNNAVNRSGEFGRFQMDNLSSPPGYGNRSAFERIELMRRNLLVGILLLNGVAGLARAESFIAKLPEVGTSVVYEYSANVDERDTTSKLTGTMKLHRLVDDRETGSSRLGLVFDISSTSSHRHTEFVLKVRELADKIELQLATIKYDSEIEKELPSDHLEFQGLKQLFDIETHDEPTASCFTEGKVRYCATTTVQDESKTPYGAGSLTTIATREIDGKSISTATIQIKSISK